MSCLRSARRLLPMQWHFARCQFAVQNPCITMVSENASPLCQHASPSCWRPRFAAVSFHTSIPHHEKSPKKDKKNPKKVQFTPEELEGLVSLEEYEDSLKNLIHEFQETLHKQFSLKMTSASLEGIEVEFGGERHKLTEIAQISLKNPQMIMINLSATPSYAKPAMLALEEAGMNFSPQMEGDMIYIPIPKVSREYRETIVKNARAASNKFKERVRRVQNTVVTDVKGKTGHPADRVRSVVQLLMEKADACSKEMDAILKSKEKELLNVEKE
ncbi:ribosome-recycling factor, mitochondrial-like [Paramacrobiotus metropolitanus]|uniref:ribosome-recycling factor, mitochondrial-like n=1 Tax=Paramacrobiotus metropolitanus TaxID=2943436 RepID=UPI002445C301|nr:ribosome-recycling factor, mitochondrial-like [Paramacrobiotus metropolitanus]